MLGTTAFKDLVAPSLRSGRYSQSFYTLTTVEPHTTYPNLYLGQISFKSGAVDVSLAVSAKCRVP